MTFDDDQFFYQCPSSTAEIETYKIFHSSIKIIYMNKPAPRRAHPRRRTAAKRKADELEQIENRPSGLVNRTVRDAARAQLQAEAFAWDVNGREF